MAKDWAKKLKGSWWIGWVRYSYYSTMTQSQEIGERTTDYEFATSGQAQRAANALASALAAPLSRSRIDRRYRSKTDKRQSEFKILETGARRVE